MADTKTPSPAASQTASLDEVLASLEKQVDSTETLAAQTVTTPVAHVPEPTPVDTDTVITPAAPLATPELVEITPAAASSTTQDPQPIAEKPILPSFESGEQHIEASVTPQIVTPPVATAVISESPAVVAPPSTSPEVSPDTPQPSSSGRPPRKWNFKIFAAAAAVFVLMIGAVAAYVAIGQPFGSVDPRQRACNWICTNCGCGCSDNKDLYSCGNPGPIPTGDPGNVDPNQGKCTNGWVKGQSACVNGRSLVCITPGSGVQDVGCCGSGCTQSPAPTAPPSASCGTSGASCCDPFSNSGVICYNNLFCNTGTGKCQSTPPTNICGGNQGSGGVIGSMCEVYTCGNSCNRGNECTLNRQVVPCSTASLGGQCGQIDYLDSNGSYCGVKVQNCGGNCGGSTTPPSPTPTLRPSPTPTPIPTPVPACGSTCTSNSNCPSGLICSTSGSTKVCRNPSCTSATNCICPTASPTQTPSPTPTTSPSPSPTAPPLACLRITRDVQNPSLGSQVRFTCGLVTGATSYEFRYKITVNETPVGGSLQSSGNISSPLTISQPGTYKVQCRPCIGAACTAWEAW